jgi:hypothetical protein
MSFEIETHGLLLEVEVTDIDTDGSVCGWEIVSFEVDDAEEWAEWEIPSTLPAIRLHFRGADWAAEIEEKLRDQEEADRLFWLEG